jgi:hypothetical protein
VVRDPLAPPTTAIPAEQIRRDAAFIEKDEAGRVQRRRGRLPVVPRRADIRSVVFGRAYGFF